MRDEELFHELVPALIIDGSHPCAEDFMTCTFFHVTLLAFRAAGDQVEQLLARLKTLFPVTRNAK